MITIEHPTKDRAVRALLLAPLLPVGILFVLDAVDRAIHFGPLHIAGAALLAFYVLIVVGVFSMVLGGVVLAALWQRVPFNLFLCALFGGLVAALPFVVIEILSNAINYNAWVDGQPTVIDGVKTAYGRWRDFLALLEVFALGTIGGGFFWWLCRSKKPKGPEVQ